MEDGERIHFIGIGGSGMSPLAQIMSGLGWRVSGSDIRFSPHLADLAALGAHVYQGHDPLSVQDASLVVASAAVPPDDPELATARSLGIRVITRAELLGEIMRPRRGIAVTGTHGKTTTSAMIALIMEEAGLDPTIAVGAGLPWLASGGKAGRGEFMVAEADEAYRSFLKLEPEVAVVTNIDDDHRDHYGSFEAIVSAFSQFLARIKPMGMAVLCADDPNVARAAAGLKRTVVRYGMTAEADYAMSEPRSLGLGSRFAVARRGKPLGQVELSVPGMHNMSNAMAAIAVCDQLGVHFDLVRAGLARFSGADRRCQILARTPNVTLIDDYAHHPAEIRATLAALRQAASGRLVAVFQPQRFSRTKLLHDEFVRSFSLADVIAVTEVYYEGTGESPIPGVTGEHLAQSIEAYEGRPVFFLPDRDALEGFLRGAVIPGGTIVTMGAGDIYRTSRRFAEELLRSGARPGPSEDGRW